MFHKIFSDTTQAQRIVDREIKIEERMQTGENIINALGSFKDDFLDKIADRVIEKLEAEGRILTPPKSVDKIPTLNIEPPRDTPNMALSANIMQV